VPRGFTWAVYFDDQDNQWALLVDSDYIGHLERGWTLAGDTGLVPLPRQWRARYVVGLDELGQTQRAICSSVQTDLWTGVATQFVIRDSEGQPQVCNVIRRVAEVRTAVRLDAQFTTP
jgi:hypothetical protein